MSFFRRLTNLGRGLVREWAREDDPEVDLDDPPRRPSPAGEAPADERPLPDDDPGLAEEIRRRREHAEDPEPRKRRL